MSKAVFQFKHFDVRHENSALKVGADAMMLGALIQDDHAKSAIDIGAGTGVLSLMLAQKNRLTKIDAIEVDEKSFLDCQFNFVKSPWADRLNAVHADIISFIPTEKYDLILSNPPFYSDSLINTDERIARTKHAEFLPIKSLISWMANNISDVGACWMIWPIETIHLLDDEIKNNEMHVHKRIAIKSKPDRLSRVVLKFGKNRIKITEMELTIRDERNNYTAEYIELTKDFHAVDLSIKNSKG